MTAGPERSERTYRWRAALGQIAVFIVIVSAVYAWQTRHLLAADRSLAPELRLPSLSGPMYDLGQSKASSTLVYFFAPWCHVCAASAHNLRALRRSRDSDSLELVLVALDWSNTDEVREYVERHDLGAELVVLGNAGTGARWQVPGYPTYYVLDAEQRIAWRDFGYSTEAGLRLRFALTR